MVRGAFVPLDYSAPIETREFAGLDDYHDAVGGRLERVDVPALGVTIYVNEEGPIRQLPLNTRVTFLWWFHVPAARQKAMLVGDAVLVGMPDHKGDSTDLPNIVIGLTAPDHLWRIEYLTESEASWR